MTDAVEAVGENVEQEAADELVRAERHGALAVGAVAAIVLVAERDTGLVECDQPVVRDGNAVILGACCIGVAVAAIWWS
jgi:hypothetical protein